MRLFNPSWAVLALFPHLLRLANAASDPLDGKEYMQSLRISDFEPASSLQKRANDLSQLDPRDTDTLLWGANPKNGSSIISYANMTMFARDGERIISVERFRPMLKSLQCGPKMVLAFNSKEHFDYAIKAWNWVNENETHTFIMVADDPGCGRDGDRAPYLIYNADYDEENHIAYLYGMEKKISEVAANFDLEYGEIHASDPQAALERRFGELTWQKSISLGMNHKLNGNWFDVHDKTNRLKLDCVNCGTSGKFVSKIRVVVRFFVPIDLVWSIQPKDVRAYLGLELEVVKSTGGLSLSYSKQLSKTQLWPPPPEGELALSLPLIHNLGEAGVFLKFKLGVSVQTQKLDAKIDFGVQALLRNDAVAQIGFGGDSTKVSGWGPIFKPMPFHISNKGKTKLSLYLQISLGPSLDILGVGVEGVGVLRIPQFIYEIDNLNEKGSETACVKKGLKGLSVDEYLAFSAALRVGKSGDLALTQDATSWNVGNTLARRDLEEMNSADIWPRSDIGPRREWRRRISGAQTKLHEESWTDIAPRESTEPELGKRGGFGARYQVTLYAPKGIHTNAFCIGGKKEKLTPVKPPPNKPARKRPAPKKPAPKPGLTPKPPAPKPKEPKPKPKEPKPSPGPAPTPPGSKKPQSKPKPKPQAPRKKKPQTCKMIEDGVRYRKCASTAKKCTALGQYPINKKVTFTCQTQGEEVKPHNRAWGKTKDGKFVYLMFVEKACADLPDC